MPELTREALFAALRSRHHYGTIGARIFLDVQGKFAEPVIVLSDDPQLGPLEERKQRLAQMGDIVRPGSAVMHLEAEVLGTAPNLGR